MPSKYDTNPLDPDFPEKAKAAGVNGDATRVLEQTGAETRHFPPISEEETRRFAGGSTGAAYMPPYTGQHVPAAYTAGGYAVTDRKRKIARIGSPENIAA